MAAATARQIPVVNNVITDEDFEKLRTEGKVRQYLMQRSYMVGKQSKITCCFFTAFWQTCSSQRSENTQTSHRQTLGKSFIIVLGSLKMPAYCRIGYIWS